MMKGWPKKLKLGVSKNEVPLKTLGWKMLVTGASEEMLLPDPPTGLQKPFMPKELDLKLVPKKSVPLFSPKGIFDAPVIRTTLAPLDD